jgi:hypothetical protein
MVIRGRVENGVVVLIDAVCLPEGQVVSVIAPPLATTKPHSILDTPAVSLGSVVPADTTGDDLLGKMLEGRP